MPMPEIAKQVGERITYKPKTMTRRLREGKLPLTLALYDKDASWLIGRDADGNDTQFGCVSATSAEASQIIATEICRRWNIVTELEAPHASRTS